MNAAGPMLPFMREKRTIDERFSVFDGAHPEIFDLFRRFAGELRRARPGRGSARLIVERIRWFYAVNPEKDEGFRVNDNFISRYARKLMEEDPTFAGYFETRRLTSRGGDDDGDPGS